MVNVVDVVVYRGLVMGRVVGGQQVGELWWAGRRQREAGEGDASARARAMAPKACSEGRA